MASRYGILSKDYPANVVLRAGGS